MALQMSPVEMHPAVRLAWLIANREAALASCACVTPAHVLLGVLKILDDSYDREAEAFNLDAKDLEQVNEMVRISRPLLHMSESELKAARRGLHQALPDNNSGPTMTRVRRLQWSGDCLYLYQKVMARAFSSSERTITLIHLLEELLENLPPEAFPFFQHHPRARAAINSSEDDKNQVQYDSLLWPSSTALDED